MVFRLAVYRFENCELDVSQYVFRRDGERVGLEPRVFDLLHYLIQHRDRAVDKDELQDAVWATIVTEASLARAIMKARRVVGDDATRQAVIRTVRRYGYQFVAPVTDLSTQPADAKPSADSDSPASTGAPSLAVLPFFDLSPDKDQDYFCEGIAEEILNALCRLDGLHLAARTSALQYKDRAVDVREVGRALGVDNVLEGSVRRAGERLRVTAQLIDARTGYHLWSERYDRTTEDIFAIQDEISTRIVGALRLELTPSDRASLQITAPSSFTAYDCYLHGLKFLHRFGRRNLQVAIDMFERAIQADSSYAPAWAGLSEAYCLLYRYAEPEEEHRERALSASEKAIQLDPDCAEAQVARGLSADLMEDYAGAEDAFETAIERNPKLYEAWYFYARCCAAIGDFEKAAGLFERAAEVDPEDYQAIIIAMQAYDRLGDGESRTDAARRAVRRAEKRLARNPDDVRALDLSAHAWIVLGFPEKGIAWAERALAIQPDDAATNYNAACAYVSVGDHERALELLENVSLKGLVNRSWMESDATLDPLREHPRFKAILLEAK